MFVHRHMGACRLLIEPLQRRAGIDHGFQRREALAGNNEQGALRANGSQHFLQGVAIHIADEMKAFATHGMRAHGTHCHIWPQVRATNTDIDDVGDGCIVMHRLGKGQKSLSGRIHLLPYSLKMSGHSVGIRRAQQPMHDLALLARIDGGTRKHGIAPSQHLARFGQCQQLLPHLAIYMRFGGVHMQQLTCRIVHCAAELFQPPGVNHECSTHIKMFFLLTSNPFARRGEPRGQGLQGLPFAALVQSRRIQKLRKRYHGAYTCASMSCSTFSVSAAKARMPSASFSVAMASAFSAKRKAGS